MSRRYKIGIQPVYDQAFDHLKMSSIVMNSSARSRSFSHSGDWSSRQYIKLLIDEWKGNETGRYYSPESRQWVLARIPLLQQKLTELEKQYAGREQQAENEGKEFTEAQDLHERKMQLQAAMDISNEELAVLEDILKNLKEEDEEIEERKILSRGLAQAGRLRDGILCELDGQRCEMINDVLIIVEPSSPYRGMSVKDYRRLAKSWAKARREIENEQVKTKRRLNPSQTFDETWAERCQELKAKHSEWERLFAQKIPSCSRKIPAWPTGIQNYLKEDKKDGKK